MPGAVQRLRSTTSGSSSQQVPMAPRSYPAILLLDLAPAVCGYTAQQWLLREHCHFLSQAFFHHRQESALPGGDFCFLTMRLQTQPPCSPISKNTCLVLLSVSRSQFESIYRLHVTEIPFPSAGEVYSRQVKLPRMCRTSVIIKANVPPKQAWKQHPPVAQFDRRMAMHALAAAMATFQAKDVLCAQAGAQPESVSTTQLQAQYDTYAGVQDAFPQP